jgi:hypothetical protein
MVSLKNGALSLKGFTNNDMITFWIKPPCQNNDFKKFETCFENTNPDASSEG